jgi:hypothetical protein
MAAVSFIDRGNRNTPSLTISPARVEARAGGSVQLRCQPQGSGPFNIEWMKVDGILNPSATQSVDGLLEIRQVTAADAGRYRCLATSSDRGSNPRSTTLEASMLTITPLMRFLCVKLSIK